MKAIVTGISGQDGHFATKSLLAMGYSVVGLTSDSAKADTVRRAFAGAPVEVMLFDYLEPSAARSLVERVRPELILNFAAMATGQGMFDAPLTMSRLNGAFVLDLLEAIRHVNPSIALCQASSAEMYGDVDFCPQDERTPFRPKSLYGAAKLYAHNLIGIYRAAFGLRCSAAILYNHESILRSTAFVTRKISHAAAAIRLGRQDRFSLSDIEAKRDWGYAPEYVEAMVLMALSPAPRDYVVATGTLTSVADVCRICFSHLGLDYQDYLVLDESLRRSIRSTNLRGNPSAIHQDLGWRATVGVEQLLVEMVEFDLKQLNLAPATTF